MKDERCKEFVRLADVVGRAMHAVYAACERQEIARKANADTLPFAAAVVAARAVERGAVQALEKHRREHGCE
jgi:hypothetical protein